MFFIKVNFSNNIDKLNKNEIEMANSSPINDL